MEAERRKTVQGEANPSPVVLLDEMKGSIFPVKLGRAQRIIKKICSENSAENQMKTVPQKPNSRLNP